MILDARSDRGSATVLVVAGLALLLLTLVVGLGVAGARAESLVADTAADLAALAGATAQDEGRGGCAVASDLASRNGVALTECEVLEDGSVQVSVTRIRRDVFRRVGPPTVQGAARAGPVPIDPAP